MANVVSHVEVSNEMFESIYNYRNLDDESYTFIAVLGSFLSMEYGIKSLHSWLLIAVSQIHKL